MKYKKVSAPEEMRLFFLENNIKYWMNGTEIRKVDYCHYPCYAIIENGHGRWQGTTEGLKDEK
jgi:hypothetical protein